MGLRLLWLVLAVLSGLPLAYLAFLLNPLLFLALGPERWREQTARLTPWRWWLLCALAVFSLSVALLVSGRG